MNFRACYHNRCAATIRGLQRSELSSPSKFISIDSDGTTFEDVKQTDPSLVDPRLSDLETSRRSAVQMGDLGAASDTP
jgi:hypothetical protein